MSICREQGQQGFVLDDDLVEQNLHSTFSASGEEKTEQEHGRLPDQARSFINGSSLFKIAHTMLGGNRITFQPTPQRLTCCGTPARFHREVVAWFSGNWGEQNSLLPIYWDAAQSASPRLRCAKLTTLRSCSLTGSAAYW